jgi:hypothetical protein
MSVQRAQNLKACWLWWNNITSLTVGSVKLSWLCPTIKGSNWSGTLFTSVPRDIFQQPCRNRIPWNSVNKIPLNSMENMRKSVRCLWKIPWNSMENSMNRRNDFRQGMFIGIKFYGTWPCGQTGTWACPTLAGSSPSSGSELIFRIGLLLTEFPLRSKILCYLTWNKSWLLMFSAFKIKISFLKGPENHMRSALSMGVGVGPSCYIS